jgi:hypothetical protein
MKQTPRATSAEAVSGLAVCIRCQEVLRLVNTLRGFKVIGDVL